MSSVIDSLSEVLESRRGADPKSSYVASLYAAGRAHILEKIEEEAGELVVAGRSETDEQVIHEAADLWFHTMVLLVDRGLQPRQVLTELERRFGRPGLEEKAARSSTAD